MRRWGVRGRRALREGVILTVARYAVWYRGRIMLTFSQPGVNLGEDSERDTAKTQGDYYPVSHHKHPFRCMNFSP